MSRPPGSLLAALVGSTLVVGSLVAVVAMGGLVAGIGPFAVAAASADPTAGWSPEGLVAAATATPRSTEFPIATSSPDPSPSVTPAPSASPTPTPAPTPKPTPKPAIDLPANGPVAVDLYGRRDFVSQATKEQCVAGAMQTMLNIANVIDDRSTRTQSRIETLAHRLSKDRRGGTEPEGWAAGLMKLGLGPYQVTASDSRTTAILRAARAIVQTGRPVGLLVWRGAHSWVMHGFKATANPLTHKDAKITHIWVSDPWYPRVSSIWGASRPPDSLVPVGRLGEDYLPWRRPTGRYPGKDGKFVAVVPYVKG